MKKVLFSLLMAFVCLPMAFGQSKDAPNVQTTDTVVCGSLNWIDGNTYATDTVVMYVSGSDAYILRLTIDTGSVTIDTTVVACGSFMSPWNELLTESGVYMKDTVINGCEHHDTVTLTIHDTYTAETEYVTAGCSYQWGDMVITDSEMHTRTLHTTEGCDSVLSIQVTSFSHQNIVNDTVAVCGQFVASWGTTYNNSGDYTVSVTDTATNCETVTNLNLTVNPIYTDTVVRDVEGGCDYVWQGQTYTDTNVVHTAVVQTAAGCDSLIAIRITRYTNHNYDTAVVESCGKRYPVSSTATWYGMVFQNQGDTNLTPINRVVTADTAITANGCTVHHHLQLTFVHEYDTANISGCQEATYTFDARNGTAGLRERAYFTVSGEYDTDTNGVPLYTKHWSTSCIRHHHVNVNVIAPEQRLRPDTMVVDRCDKYFFKYRNVSFDTIYADTAFTFIYPFHDLNNELCHDSIIEVDITIRYSSHRDTVVVACDTFTWNFNGKLYTGSGTYNQKIADTTNSQGCDSIGQLKLTINRTPVVSIEGNWMLMPGDETANLSANCTESNVNFKWYTGTSTTPASTTATLSVTPQNGENVDVHLVTTKSYSGGHSCVANNWVTVTCNVGIDEVEAMQVSVYPNPASRVLNIQSVDGVSEVVIYNTLGQQLLRQNGNGERMQLDLGSLAAGSYTLRITAANGEQVTRKINVAK